jgi:hypothetical protein
MHPQRWMPVTITVSGPRLSETQFTTRDLMREIGLLVRERVLRRTIGGTDANDAPFTPYSATYAALKSAELGTSDVNLQVSGAMLNALQILDVTDHSVTMGYA